MLVGFGAPNSDVGVGVQGDGRSVGEGDGALFADGGFEVARGGDVAGKSGNEAEGGGAGSTF